MATGKRELPPVVARLREIRDQLERLVDDLGPPKREEEERPEGEEG